MAGDKRGRRGVTIPVDHRWRCECGADHFLVFAWNADDEGGVADASGELGIEDKPPVTWRYRLALAWQLLRNGHSATGVSVQLDAAKAREIAAGLSRFADSATGDYAALAASETESETGEHRRILRRRPAPGEDDPAWDEAAAAADAGEPVELARPPREITVEYWRTCDVFIATSPDIRGFRVGGMNREEVRHIARARLAAFLDPAVTVTEIDRDGDGP